MIAVIDYGMGNLRSVSKALEHVGAAVQVTSDPHTLERAEKIILPGVGAFPSAMRELRARKLVDPIKEAIAVGKPYLGICLGLQLLFERSEEGEGVEGLGIVPGVVRRFQAPPARRAHWPGRASLKRQAALKIPHMGWNQVNGDKRQATSDVPCCRAFLREATSTSCTRTTRIRWIEGWSSSRRNMGFGLRRWYGKTISLPRSFTPRRARRLGSRC